jgi:hypothetical protein
MLKFLILLLISIEIIIITRLLCTLYYRILEIDVLLIRNRVVAYIVKSDEKINISEQVVLDFFACECFARETFNFVFKKRS